MQILADLLNTIQYIDSAAMSRAQRHIDGLLKPVGSTGSWRRLPYNCRNAGVEWHTACGQKAVLVMCAVTASGRKGRYFPKVTAIQAENMTRGTTGVYYCAGRTSGR